MIHFQRMWTSNVWPTQVRANNFFVSVNICFIFITNLILVLQYLDGQDVVTDDLRANLLSLEMKEAIVEFTGIRLSI